VSESRPLRVAVVGSGPSGVYAAGHLVEHASGTWLDGRMQRCAPGRVEVDIIERLPTPWGLLRAGVAPDHFAKKKVADLFDSIATRPGIRFLGNVEVGRDVSTAELSEWYDAVVYAVGATHGRLLDVPGNDLPGYWTSRDFVAWYNGHPDFTTRSVDLTADRAVIVGNGNVALDVARILTLPAETLAATDISPHAEEVLRHSAIREVVVLGRRSPADASFTNAELAELEFLPGVDVLVDPGSIGDDVFAGTNANFANARRLATLERLFQRSVQGHPRRIVLRFLASPISLEGAERVQSIQIGHNHVDVSQGGRRVTATDQTSTLDAGLVISAIGYRSTPVPGLPFDETSAVIPTSNSRIMTAEGVLPGAYATGWVKRGPTGIIGNNKLCARNAALAVFADAEAGLLPSENTRSFDAVADTLRQRQPTLVSWSDWRTLDSTERSRGYARGKPRLKMLNVEEMLDVVTRESVP
jgi:ferredoxin--NADP+ reductase